jgi:hypothetical protein
VRSCTSTTLSIEPDTMRVPSTAVESEPVVTWTRLVPVKRAGPDQVGDGSLGFL